MSTFVRDILLCVEPGRWCELCWLPCGLRFIEIGGGWCDLWWLFVFCLCVGVSRDGWSFVLNVTFKEKRFYILWFFYKNGNTYFVLTSTTVYLASDEYLYIYKHTSWNMRQTWYKLEYETNMTQKWFNFIKAI